MPMFNILRVGYRQLEIEADTLEQALAEAPNRDFGSEFDYEYVAPGDDEESVKVKFEIDGTIVQTIVPSEKGVDLLKLLQDGNAVTTLGKSGQVLSIPDLKVIGRVVDTTVLDDTSSRYIGSTQ